MPSMYDMHCFSHWSVVIAQTAWFHFACNFILAENVTVIIISATVGWQ